MSLYPQLRKPLLIGVTCAVTFVAFFCAALLSHILGKSWDAQVAVAFLSAPTSAVLLNLAADLLQVFGGQGGVGEQVAQWSVLLCAGMFQWFLVGFLAAFLLLVPGRPEPDHFPKP